MKFRKTRASLVVSDEYRGLHFKDGKIDDTKRKFEGHGSIHETKGCDPIIIFKEAFFMVANNTLPKILSPHTDDLEIDEMYNKSALLSRMRLFKFEAKYNQKHDKFPFDTSEFAKLLHYVWLKIKDQPIYERANQDKDVDEDEIRMKEEGSFEGGPTFK